MIFQFNNTAIYYETHGKGPALLLLHGFLESARIWKEFIQPLSEKYTLVILDLPGHGKSDIIAEIHAMELMAKVIDGLFQHLKIDNAIVLGHSMGGYVALAFTELFEEKVSKLILLNSTPEADSEERKENRNRAIQLIEKEKVSFLSMAISNLFSETSRKIYGKEIERLKKDANCFPSKGITANSKGMRDRKDRTHILKSFSKEKWMVCGQEDPIVPIATSKSIAKTTNTPLYILPGSHMSWLENKDEIVKFLLFTD